MLFSIVTINLNNATGLKKTIDSVFIQTYTSYEYIVIDGGSTDGSVNIIGEYSDVIDFKIIEKDSGIYNAMNKGILNSKGKYLLFLNSGDVLADKNVLSKVILELNNEDLVYGNLLTNTKGGIEETRFPDLIDFEFMVNATLPHPATFINKKLFSTAGLFYEEYKIVSDWLFFMIALFRVNCSYKHINVPVAIFDMSGISNDINFADVHKDERINVLETKFKSELVLYEKYKLYQKKFLQITSHPLIKPFLKMKISLSKGFSK